MIPELFNGFLNSVMRKIQMIATQAKKRKQYNVYSRTPKKL